MSKKITKAGLASRLELAGYTTAEANKFLTTFSNIVSKELCSGNSVIITEVGTLVSTIKGEKVMQVNAVDKKIPQRVYVKFRVSKFLKERFKAEFSKEGKTKEELKKLGSAFKKILQ